MKKAAYDIEVQTKVCIFNLIYKLIIFFNQIESGTSVILTATLCVMNTQGNICTYADDCQLYITEGKCFMTKYKMETLLAEIKQWMSTDMLKLNDSKTEIMAVG